MSILDANDLLAITQATRDTYGTIIERPQVYRIGRKPPNGTRQIKSFRGEIWVRPYTGDDDQRHAVSAKYPSDWDPANIIFNSFVEVVTHGNGLRVTGYAPENAEFMGDVVVRPQRLVDQSQLNLNLMLPTDPASMRVQVTPAQYIVDEAIYAAPLRLTDDLSSYLPTTAGNAVGVLIEYDPANATFHYTASAEFTNVPLQDALRGGLLPMELDYFCCGWVKLIYGQTSIQHTDILPEQHILSKGGGLAGCVKTVIDKPTVLPPDHACIVPYALEIAPGGSLDIVGDLYIVNLDSLI